MARRPPLRLYRGPVVDMHVHPQLGAEPIMGTRPHRAEDYLRAARPLRVEHAAALVMAPAGDLKATRRGNDQVLELARASRGKFFAVCSVHPFDGAAARREVQRVAKAGARALKLHPNTQDFDVADTRVRGIVCEAATAELPVLFDAYSPFDADQPGKFILLAMQEPTARIILAHAHGPHFLDLLVYDVLARYPWWPRNVWVDLSATSTLLAGGPYEEGFVWTLRKMGVDRVLFGSDYPLDPPVRAVEAVQAMGFSPAELARIYFQNSMALFGLRGPPPRVTRGK